jgi:hypothetical protein
MKFYDIEQNFTLLYFDFVHFLCVSLTFVFDLGDFESLLQNLGLARTSSKI